MVAGAGGTEGVNGGTLTVAAILGPMAGDTVGVTPTGPTAAAEADDGVLKCVWTTSAKTAFMR